MTDPIPIRPRAALSIDLADPYAIAKEYVDGWHASGDSYTLWYARGTFYSWRGSHYVELPTDEIRQMLYAFLFDQCVASKDGKPIKANRAAIDNLLDALKAAAILPSQFVAPCWIMDPVRQPAPAQAILPVVNGLLDVRSRKLHPASGAFFTTFGLPFAFDPDAPTSPPEWCAFLQSIWPNDFESIRCLRQMCGYFLTLDHRHQKMFLLVGPRRAGKGVIATILKELVGPENFVSPTLAAFGSPFGLEPLTKASVACISDARLSSRSDLGQVTENLLKISAGDHSTVPRKFRLDWNGVIPARLLMLSNDLPRIADASGALASRFIVLRMTESFLGREDKGLAARLRLELPGILNWALVGLDDLNDEGWFIEPASSREVVQELHDLGSPIGAFLRDECVVDPYVRITTDLLFGRWRDWCEANHRDDKLVGDLAGFGAKLRSAAPSIVRRRLRLPNGERAYFYVGVRSKSEQEKTETADDPLDPVPACP